MKIYGTLLILACECLLSGCTALANRIADAMSQNVAREIATERAPAVFNLIDSPGFRTCLARKGHNLETTATGGAGSCAVDAEVITLLSTRPEPWPVGCPECNGNGGGGGCPECFFRDLFAVVFGNQFALAAKASPKDTVQATRETCKQCADGSCSPDASAMCVLISEEHSALMRLSDRLAALDSKRPELPGATATLDEEITFTLDDFENHVNLIQKAAYNDGFGQLHDRAVEFGSRYAGKKTSGDEEMIRKLDYISEYIKAYFREGKILAYNIDFSKFRESAENEIIKKIPELADNEDAKSIIQTSLERWFPGVEGERGDIGFVSRGGGGKYQFSGVKFEATVGGDSSVTFEGPTEEPIEVGNTLLRLVIEGSFDAVHRLPAVADATAVKARAGGFKHTVNNPDAPHGPNSGFLSEEDFLEVERWSNTGEGAAKAVTGRLIRGVSWLALNNEALAGLLETFVGVTVRKVVEKAAYCALSCLDDENEDTNVSIVRAPMAYPATVWFSLRRDATTKEN